MKSNGSRFGNSRFYSRDGKAVYEVPKKSGKGTKRVTITEARELDLLPSVTTIIKTLDKPALTDWKIREAVYAISTAPDVPGESLDDKIVRVLDVEKQGEETASIAADLGTAIHDALDKAIQGVAFNPKYRPYIEAALPVVRALGRMAWTEKVLIGDGYAGRGDYAAETDQHVLLLDFKTTGNVPKEAYKEHRMQVAAYCKTLGNVSDRHIIGGLLYLSTKNPGEINLCLLENWERDYEEGFVPLLKVWQYVNDYIPKV